MHILVVDDEFFILKLMEDLLPSLGHTMIGTENGREGLEALHSHTVDAIITDLQMPEMGGLEFLRKVAHLKTPPPVVVLTGYAELHTAVETLRLGAFDLLQKPISADTLSICLLRLEQHLEQNRQLAQAQEARLRAELTCDTKSAEAESLAQLLKAIPIPVFTKDLEGRYTGGNEAFADFLGTPLEKIVGKTVFDIAPAELAALYHEKDTQLFHAKTRQVYESGVKGADGLERQVIFHKSVTRDIEGTVDGLIGVIIDMTEQRKSEAELHASEARYRRIFEDSGDAILVHDDDGQICNANEAASQLLTYSRESLIRMKLFDLRPADTRDQASRLFETYQQTGELRFEQRMQRADGTLVDVEVHARRFEDDSGLGLSLIRDISLRKRLQEEQERYAQQLEEEAKRAREYAESVLRTTTPGTNPIGAGEAHEAALQFIAQAGAAPSPVLILGESGTGKEVMARAIHAVSPRSAAPLVVIDCAALHDTLLESELFGHEKGAFTGAHAAKAGLVEVALGGTLFIDEIGEMPLELQAKLLRVLDRGDYRRLGATEERHADVRILAATHRLLEKEVKTGRFRKDLYYRLNVLSFTLKPLRERPEDIPLLAQHFLQHNRLHRTHRPGLTQESIARLQNYHWPGNIRELQNVIERALIIAGDAEELPLASFPPEIQKARPAGSSSTGSMRLTDLEREQIKSALQAAGGNLSQAARALGVSRRTLYRKLDRYGLR